jgi:hypothetical protein
MAESNLPGTEAGPAGRAPSWLVRAVDDLVGCALDPDCPARECREGEDGHAPLREVHAVLGPDKAYLCSRHMREALDRGLIEPCPCVRCGRAPGTHIGSSRAAGTVITVWHRVCAACRPQVDRELGRAA